MSEWTNSCEIVDNYISRFLFHKSVLQETMNTGYSLDQFNIISGLPISKKMMFLNIHMREARE